MLDPHGGRAAHISPKNLGDWGHRRHGAPFHRLAAPVSCCLVAGKAHAQNKCCPTEKQRYRPQLWHCRRCSCGATLKRVCGYLYFLLYKSLFLCTTPYCSSCKVHCKFACSRNSAGSHNECQGLQSHLHVCGMQAIWLPEFLVQLLCWLMPSLTSWQLLQIRLQMQVFS